MTMRNLTQLCARVIVKVNRVNATAKARISAKEATIHFLLIACNNESTFSLAALSETRHNIQRLLPKSALATSTDQGVRFV